MGTEKQEMVAVLQANKRDGGGGGPLPSQPSEGTKPTDSLTLDFYCLGLDIISVARDTCLQCFVMDSFTC